MSMLSRALRLAFELTGDDADLRESVTLADRALAGLAEGSPNWSSFHTQVANVRLAAFERFDSLDDLTSAERRCDTRPRAGSVAPQPIRAHRGTRRAQRERARVPGDPSGRRSRNCLTVDVFEHRHQPGAERWRCHRESNVLHVCNNLDVND
ncbi:hypothetical protein ABZX92_35090 [Lentzea sp. NPDC006480]|uniref:hypothetical protein n=1 Tax=Lentzea sp. NPDC006480 TaxID=3157176 RepID=UPI0033AD8F57